MNLYRIASDPVRVLEADDKYVEAPTILEAIRLWKLDICSDREGQIALNDIADPVSVVKVSDYAAIRTKKLTQRRTA